MYYYINITTIDHTDYCNHTSKLTSHRVKTTNNDTNNNDISYTNIQLFN